MRSCRASFGFTKISTGGISPVSGTSTETESWKSSRGTPVGVEASFAPSRNSYRLGGRGGVVKRPSGEIGIMSK